MALANWRTKNGPVRVSLCLRSPPSQMITTVAEKERRGVGYLWREGGVDPTPGTIDEDVHLVSSLSQCVYNQEPLLLFPPTIHSDPPEFWASKVHLRGFTKPHTEMTFVDFFAGSVGGMCSSDYDSYNKMTKLSLIIELQNLECDKLLKKSSESLDIFLNSLSQILISESSIHMWFVSKCQLQIPRILRQTVIEVSRRFGNFLRSTGRRFKAVTPCLITFPFGQTIYESLIIFIFFTKKNSIEKKIKGYRLPRDNNVW